jgi:hypothetical protein
MKNEFDDVMGRRTDAELIAILNSTAGDYQPAAMEAAKRVFDSRNLSQEQVEIAEQELEQMHLNEEANANEPLGFGLKILAMILPGILMLMFAGVFKADGYDRKAKDMVKWTLYGVGIYFGLALLIMILMRMPRQ